MRGEYKVEHMIAELTAELPPRARRIHQISLRAIMVIGTTSACAENTVPQKCNLWGPRNYLRVRGEYNGAMERWDNALELPPRARRIQIRTISASQMIGTTSACAENTITKPILSGTIRNYLRVRGEYASTWLLGMPRGELPPRARRIRTHGPLQIRWLGTTSACAENTRYHGSYTAGVGNYLRVRGEYSR